MDMDLAGMATLGMRIPDITIDIERGNLFSFSWQNERSRNGAEIRVRRQYNGKVAVEII